MSDYGDDYSDYGEEWFYVEEEFIAADDLAEHAVASPPPTTYADEDAAEDWDRFDYFNDLEYASDGYDDAVFQVQGTNGQKTGQKRKRHVKPSQSKKRQRILGDTEAAALGMSPVVWRSQKNRGVQPKLLDEHAQTYTILQDWRQKLKDSPRWAKGSPPQSPTVRAAKEQKLIAEVIATAEQASSPHDLDVEDERAQADEMDIDPGVLMAALQTRLAEAGGPLSDMDPQQLLDFAMRIATGKDTGVDIAGDMADAMLNQREEDDEEDPEAEANLLAWVAQQRNHGTKPSASVIQPQTTNDVERPPTPPEEKASASTTAKTVRASQTITKTRSQTNTSLKRKADNDNGSAEASNPTKKRATRTFDTPTAASQARTTSSKIARGGRKK